MKNFRMAIVVLAAIVLVAVTEMGRTAVNRVADYKELTTPKSLHQLALEARPDADDGGGLLLGAGLAALGLSCLGLLAFALPAGREFGRTLGRRRRKTRQRPPVAGPGVSLPTAPALRVLPPAPRAPALPSAVAEEGRYEDLR